MNRILRAGLLATLLLLVVVSTVIAKGSPTVPALWLLPIGLMSIFGAVYMATPVEKGPKGPTAAVAAFCMLVLSGMAPPAHAYTVSGSAPFCTYDGYLMQCYYYSWSACEQAVKYNPSSRCVANPNRR